MKDQKEIVPFKSRKQKTIHKEVSLSGIGIHTGLEVFLKLLPAKANEGIFFRRTDLPNRPIISANFENVFDTSRSTNIGVGDARIYTVEHLLAALKAYDIDNVCIDLSGTEPPAGNGSSDVFVEMIERAGVVELEDKVSIHGLEAPVSWSEGDIHIVALPSHEYRLSYTLHYPHSKVIGSQYFSFPLTAENFKKEIAPCRTFALYEELSYLIDNGLIKGGSLENAVVIKKDAIISKNGLFFQDEMVRHKILDLIGDLSLIGIPFLAHIIAIRSGHGSNYEFAKKLFKNLVLEKK